MATVTSRSRPRLAARLIDYWITVLKRTWRGSLVTSFVEPFLYLTAMGVGLGSFVDDNAGMQALGGVTYLAFIAPGLLATTAMQTGVFESTYPVMGGFKWHRSYFAMAASPLTPADIVLAQLAFIAFRTFATCGVFLVVLTFFSALQTWWGALVALAVSVLIGLAHAAPLVGVTSRMQDPAGFALVFRLGLLPMFLFSGAFFPITQLPTAITWVAYLTPIWHGVDLARMLTLGAVDGSSALLHVAYLAAFAVAGWFYAVAGFTKRLAL